ncbi:MAG: tRNA lysidine(34) synthetase TilS, partial [Chloroflexi bacterium]
MPELQKRLSKFMESLALGDLMLVVGVSGGPDSLALLHGLAAVMEGEHVVVAHLNHGLRGRAVEDAEFVRKTAVSLNLPHYIETIDVADWAAQHHLSLEEAGRILRYRFLAEKARECGAGAVVVGHHADDQTETVLMHLLRGSGLSGLRGMQMVRPLPEANDLLLIRPFLHTTRNEIEQYCKQHNLQPVQDESNENVDFFRNRIRHQLLPLLSAYNPRIKNRLQNLAEIVAADYELLDQLLLEAWSDLLIKHDGSWLQFDKAKWQKLPLSLQRSTLRYGVKQIRPFQSNIGFRTIEQARTMIEKGQVGSQATLPGETSLLNGYEVITIADDLAQVPHDLPLLLQDEPQVLTIPGEIRLNNDWVLQAKQLESFDFTQIENNPDDWQALVDVQTDH